MSKELEEAIKILKYHKDSLNAWNDSDNPNRIAKAIEIVLKALENSISEEVIRKTIDLLNREYLDALKENSTNAFILKCQIEILQEILKEREVK